MNIIIIDFLCSLMQNPINIKNPSLCSTGINLHNILKHAEFSHWSHVEVRKETDGSTSTAVGKEADSSTTASVGKETNGSASTEAEKGTGDDSTSAAVREEVMAPPPPQPEPPVHPHASCRVQRRGIYLYIYISVVNRGL